MKIKITEMRHLIRSILIEGTCSKCGKHNVLTSKLNGKEVCYYGCNGSVPDSSNSEPSSEDKETPKTGATLDEINGLWKKLGDLVFKAYNDYDEPGPIGPHVRQAVEIVAEDMSEFANSVETWMAMDQLSKKDFSIPGYAEYLTRASDSGYEAKQLERWIEEAFEMLGDEIGVDWKAYQAQKFGSCDLCGDPYYSVSKFCTRCDDQS